MSWKSVLTSARWSYLLVAVLAVSAAAQMDWANLPPREAAATPLVDISKAVIETTMKNYPSATALGNWGYTQALYLYGEYLVYQRTHDPLYLAYIKSWADDVGPLSRDG